MIKVIGRKSSSNVQAVLWCLQTLGIEYEQKDAGFTYGVVDTAAYRELNPNGTVPTLIDGSNPPVWESGAIIRYLASRYAEEEFWPADAVARATVDQWADWAKINVAQNFTVPVFWAVARTAPSKQNKNTIAAALQTLESYLRIADVQLAKNNWLAGEYLSVADVQFGHILFRYFDIGIERPDLQSVRRYYEHLVQLPAYRNTVMVSYDELRVTDE